MAEGTLEITISNQSVHASAITVTGAGGATTITVDKGTLLMSATVDPSDVYDDSVTWSVINGSGTASIIQFGNTVTLIASSNGTVTVRATATDGSGVYGELEITISNQAAPTLVTAVTVTSEGNATTITTDKGTLQMYAHVDPHDATNQAIIWTIAAGSALISPSGLLSALRDSTVTVRATAADGSGEYGEFVVTISNQSTLISIPDSLDFSLQDVVDVVNPSSGDALVGCFVDAGATIHDPTHVDGFDTRYEGDHDRLTNFRNYPTDINVPIDKEALYNWYAATKKTAGAGSEYGALYNWYATSVKDYGALYNWYAAADAKNIANSGWHVSTETEWQTLQTYLGGQLVAGAKLKSTGYTYWDSPNTDATNETGFNGIGSAGRSFTGTFFTTIKQISDYWTSTQYDSLNAYTHGLGYSVAWIYGGNALKKYGRSIRLIKDSTNLENGESGTYTGNDGKTYRTICINGVEWLADNLNETKYRTNEDITVVADNTSWAALTTEGMCYYDNNINNARSIAPTGWHIPAFSEWLTLRTYLGGYAVAGGKLKEIGTSHWNTPNTDADNSTGFTARGSGFRTSTGIFNALKNVCILFSSSSITESIYLAYDTASLLTTGSDQKYGYSVRCILDGVDPDDPGTVTDIDGNIYQTVKIGTQVWMAENLKVEHYNDNTDIPLIEDDTDWAADTTGAYCWYDNVSPTPVPLLPPTGWHIPTSAEFMTLINYVGGVLVAGGHLKATGLTYWDTPNEGADNISMFTCKGAGARGYNGSVVSIKKMAVFHSDDDYQDNQQYGMIIQYAHTWAYPWGTVDGDVTKYFGCSIRPIKDDSTDPGTVTDIDGNVYPTIKIGNQVWMASNLLVTHYNDNTTIPEITDNTDWMNDTDGAMCYNV